MAIFGVHVVLPRGFDYVQFAPGDELPDWAVGLVGEHCLLADLPEPPPADNERVAKAKADSVDVPAAPLDFTAPAKPGRGRPRKS